MKKSVFGYVGRGVLVLTLVMLLGGCDPIKDLVNKAWPKLTTLDQQMRAVKMSSQILAQVTHPEIAATISSDLIESDLGPAVKRKAKKAKLPKGVTKLEPKSVQVVVKNQGLQVFVDTVVHIQKGDWRGEVDTQFKGIAAPSVAGNKLLLFVAFKTLKVDDGKFWNVKNEKLKLNDSLREILASAFNTAMKHFLDNLNGVFLKDPLQIKIKQPRIKDLDPRKMLEKVDGMMVKSGRLFKSTLEFKGGVVLINEQGLHALIEVKRASSERPFKKSVVPEPKDVSEAVFEKALRSYERGFAAAWKKLTGRDLVPGTSVYVSRAFLQRQLNGMLSNPSLCVRYYPELKNYEKTDHLKVDVEKSDKDCNKIWEGFQKYNNVCPKFNYRAFNPDDCPSDSRYDDINREYNECKKPCDKKSWAKKKYCRRKCRERKLWRERFDAINRWKCRLSLAAKKQWYKTKRKAAKVAHKAKYARACAKRELMRVEFQRRVGFCKTEKEAIRFGHNFLQLGRWGVKIPLNRSVEVSACLDSLAFSGNLSKVTAKILGGVKASAKVHAFFRPKRAGHGICVAPWKRDWQQKASAAIPSKPQKIGISMEPGSGGDLDIMFRTEEFKQTVVTRPSPSQQIFKDPTLVAKCLPAVSVGIMYSAKKLFRGEISEELKAFWVGVMKVPVDSQQFKISVKPAEIELPGGKTTIKLEPQVNSKVIGYST